MDAKQTKILSNLFISGGALIVFGLLDIVKFVIYWIVDPAQFALVQALFEEDASLGYLILGIAVGTLIIELLLFLFVGFSACAESKGKKKSLFYVVVAIILAVLLVLMAIASIVFIFFEPISFLSIFDALVSFALTIVVVYILIDIVVSSFKNRKLKDAENTIVEELKENTKGKKEAEN